jgi:Fe-S-cluster containining protein
MINIYQKIQKVETLQRRVDREIANFKRQTCLDCDQHCIECCSYADVQATPLEFLPFAYHALKLGLIDQWFDELNRHDSPMCFFRRSEKNAWGCRIYPVRGLICRLFGFSAVTNKHGRPEYAACRIMKRNWPDKVRLIKESISSGRKIPVISSYYRRLASIDPCLGQEFMPINAAMKKAIETIYFSVAYRHGF